MIRARPLPAVSFNEFIRCTPGLTINLKKMLFFLFIFLNFNNSIVKIFEILIYFSFLKLFVVQFCKLCFMSYFNCDF